jgi:hypothetical protein
VRILGGIDLNNPAMAAGYPVVFESNAASYCALVTGDDGCGVAARFEKKDVQTDYHADFGIMLKANHPNPKLIDGHKYAIVVAISKPSKGLVYTTIASDSAEELERNFEPLMYSLRFK